jgi:hypothetical protein
VLVNLGEVRQYQGDYEQARASYKEGLALCQLLTDRRGMAWCLQGLGEVAGEQGQPERAARLLGAADHLLEAIDSPRTPQIAGLERHVAAIRVALGGQKFTAAWTEGRAMPLEQAISDALEPPAND